MIRIPMSMFVLRGLVRRCLAVLFTALLGGFVLSAPAAAQQGSRDVVGVTLGMTPAPSQVSISSIDRVNQTINHSVLIKESP